MVHQEASSRDRLISGAIKLMHGRSYANVGVQELCEQAGVKKGSFYHFFPSKRDLTLAALDLECERLRRDIWSRAFSKDLPPLKRIERYLELTYRSQLDYWEATGSVRGCAFGNLALELGTQDEVIRERVDRVFQDAVAIFEDTLQEAVEAGQIPRISVRRAAQSVLAYLEGMILMAKSKNDPEVIRNLSPSVFHLLISASDEAPVN